MNSRTLKIALAVSVGLNLFAVGGGAAYLISRERIERRLDDQRRAGREQGARTGIRHGGPRCRACGAWLAASGRHVNENHLQIQTIIKRLRGCPG